MRHIRKHLAVAIAAIGVLAVAAPGASAVGFTGFPVPAGGLAPSPIGGNAGAPAPCGRATANGQGSTGTADPQVCQGAGLVFVGPSTGQIATVIGPTIIGPAVIGSSVVSAGHTIVG
jgi:hypothetical protein